MINQSQCETCESLAHELAEVKRENEQLRAILSDKSLEAMRIAAYNTSQAGTVAVRAKSDESLRYIKTQLAANDRIFAQYQALMELPLKLQADEGQDRQPHGQDGFGHDRQPSERGKDQRHASRSALERATGAIPGGCVAGAGAVRPRR